MQSKELVKLGPDWLQEEVAHMVRHLDAVLHDPTSTPDEKRIAKDMLEYYSNPEAV